jgi:putative methyltransferase (TIGR04325 family)
MRLNDLIPSAVKDTVRKRHAPFFDSYSSALAACNAGYQQETLIRAVHEKTKRYRNSLESRPILCDITSLRTFIGLIGLPNSELNVIDFGGACGAHYFLARAILKSKLRWSVVESPQMVRAARDLEDDELCFFENLKDAQRSLPRVDLVFSSGALQYVPDPYQSLAELTQCGAAQIFITRVGLSSGAKEIISIQKSRLLDNGPGPLPDGVPDEVVQYPVTFASKRRFEQILQGRYTIAVQTNEDKRVHWAGEWIDYFGYLGRA